MTETTVHQGKILTESNYLGDIANGAGYDNNMAFAELIDNGIGAGAKKIDFTIGENTLTYEDWGEDAGMNEAMLKKNYFMLGNSYTKAKADAPGKYGMGGKTGILTLIGPKLTTDVEITTHKKGYAPITATWEVCPGRYDNYRYWQLLIDNRDYGTTITFKYDREIDIVSLKKYIGVMYCWAIKDGLEITINGEAIEPCDPLYRDNPNVVNNGLFKTKTFRVIPIKGKGCNVTVNVSAFNKEDIIPEEELHAWDSGGKKTRSLRTANRSGIYVRTGGRYYTLGNNFGKVMKRVQHPSLDGLRIEVCIPKQLWDEISITWNKGREVADFTKVYSLKTSGVTDYIKSVMMNFSNHKKSTEEKGSDKLMKLICELSDTPDTANDEFSVEAGANTNGKWIQHNGGKVNIDITKTDMSMKELKGAMSVLIPMYQALSKNGFGHLDLCLDAVAGHV